MNISLNRISKEIIQDHQKVYYKNISVPIDDYWQESIIGSGIYYEIVKENQIGYLVVDDRNVLLQFCLYKYKKFEKEIFKVCKEKLQFNQAYASTYELEYLNLCLDYGISYKIEAIFYRDDFDVIIEKPLDDIVEKLVDENNIKSAINYSVSEGMPLKWLKTYYENLVKRKGLYIYLLEKIVIGTGELRPDKYNIGANIGMTVSKDYRNKKIGSFILNRMKILSKEKGLNPVCGTDLDNVGSQKTIMKCGFYPYHRVLKIEF